MKEAKDVVMVFMTLWIIVWGLELSELRRAVESIENGYIELMERKLPGTSGTVGDHVKPGTMGIFSMRNKTVVCGELAVKVEPRAVPEGG